MEKTLTAEKSGSTLVLPAMVVTRVGVIDTDLAPVIDTDPDLATDTIADDAVDHEAVTDTEDKKYLRTKILTLSKKYRRHLVLSISFILFFQFG